MICVAIGLSNQLNAQIVNIPDANFKAILVADLGINTNADTEIQISEANAYTGNIDASGMIVSNLTGIEEFTSLTSLDVAWNSLTTLDLTANVGLTYVDCANNMITNLDVSNLPNLSILYCGWNSLTCLDLSTDTALTVVSAPYNNFTSFNIKNGHNTSIATFGTLSNPGLTCIQVDNASYSTTNWLAVDPGANFSTSCIQPIASFSTDAPVCTGTPLTFNNTSSNSTFWHWDFGDGSTSTIQNPTYTFNNAGDYIVSLIASNCYGHDTVGFTVAQGTQAHGHVTHSGGDVVDGLALLYPSQAMYIALDTFQIQTLDASGYYHFTNVPQGNYLVKVFANSTTYPTLVPTYFTNDWAWDSSTTFVQGCYTDGLADVTMVELTPMTPNIGFAQGYVLEGDGFGRAQGDPIHGVDIKLGITGTSNIVATDTTDAAGQFTFTNVGFGTYTVYVDIAGLERDSVYTFTIDALNNQFPNLYYVVDSVKITIIPGIGIEDFSASNIGKMDVYPNPSKGNTFIEYAINANAEVSLDVYNLLGIKVQSLVNAYQLSGEYHCNFNPKNAGLEPGIYFIALSANGKTRTKQIIVME